ncbi:MAG: 30S ribosomal protein S20 [Planctomycetota bacterium]
MPNTPSAKREVNKSLERQRRNSSHKSTMRTWIKKTLAAVEAGDAELAEKNLVQAVKMIDKNAKWHQLHPNTAARRKSRLDRLVRGLKSGNPGN